MLKKMNKNGGMSLIEVIVSMLVLSIAVVAVTMSFSTASKINMGTKQKQTTESLMENLLEYTEAGGTEYQSWFNATSAVPVTGIPEPGQEQTLYKGIKQGMYTYDVRVLVDKDPEEYNRDKLNDHPVIQFGGSSSNTIMIDASLKGFDTSVTTAFGSDVSDYDETAYNYFSIRHTQAVLEHNIIDEQEELADPDGHTEDPWDVTLLEDIPNYVDRELRLEVTKIATPSGDMMQLKAYMTYILDDAIKLPAGISNVYQGSMLFASELYDVASASEPANKLNQIYIMYSPAKLEPAGIGFGQDIRITDPDQVMSANIFIANQQESLMNQTEAVGKTSIADLDLTTYEVKVSFRKPVAGSSECLQPAGGDIYCSGNFVLQDAAAVDDTTKCYPNNLVAKNAEVRIITTTLEILEAGTDKVLATKKVTHLQ